MRQEFTKKTKLAAWERSGGKCECGCGQTIIGTPEYDHIKECAIDGDNSLENCMVMSPKCHRIKTNARRPEIVKSIRTREKNAGLRKRKGRPMPGSKGSGLRKRMDGTVWRE